MQLWEFNFIVASFKDIHKTSPRYNIPGDSQNPHAQDHVTPKTYRFACLLASVICP